MSLFHTRRVSKYNITILLTAYTLLGYSFYINLLIIKYKHSSFIHNRHI